MLPTISLEQESPALQCQIFKCPTKCSNKLIITLTCIYILICIALFTPNIWLISDVKHEIEIIDQLLDNNENKSQTIAKQIFDIQSNLEERIFNLIFKKFYKKNNTITTV
jgi:hypothetical protein